MISLLGEYRLLLKQLMLLQRYEKAIGMHLLTRVKIVARKQRYRELNRYQ